MIVGGVALMAILTWRTLAPSPSKNVSLQEPVSGADLKLDRMKYTETREGIKEWELEAASVRYFQEENMVLLEKVKATFFGKNQDTYVLVAERGKFNAQTKAIEVFDGVKIDSSDGYRMQTRSLEYRAEKRELRTSDPVEISGPQMDVRGTGLVVELDHQRLKILKQVTTTVYNSIPGASPTTL
jgi:LPS export ABC transporter protein LptC